MTCIFDLFGIPWGKDSDWFWAFCQFVVIAVTLFLIYLQFRTQTASHIVQTVLDIDERWNSEHMRSIRYEVCSQWKKGNKEFDGACEVIAEFMEDLGTFMKIKAIPADVMWEVQSWNIEHYWLMFQPGIEQMRKDVKEPDTLYSGFESLYDKMIAIGEQKSDPRKKPEDIDEFVKLEIRSNGVPKPNWQETK
jgi:hypothetical protein